MGPNYQKVRYEKKLNYDKKKILLINKFQRAEGSTHLSVEKHYKGDTSTIEVWGNLKKISNKRSITFRISCWYKL